MMDAIRKRLKSKTVNFSLILGGLGILQTNFEQLHAIIPTKYYGICMIAVGVIVYILREMTTQPLKDK